MDIGPVSGVAAEQGAAQKGEGAHIFAPYGYLDDTWFHRSYWVFGKNFAGGHNGYYQAGKYTPAGEILVFDEKNVYGYGRKAEYLKWTTTRENQIFVAPKEPPNVEAVVEAPAGKAKGKFGKKGGGKALPPMGPGVRFLDTASPDIANKPLTVAVWANAGAKDGVLVSHGGNSLGYALTLGDGKPAFAVRAEKTEATVISPAALTPGWHHLAGVLAADKKMRLFVDGKQVGETTAPGLIPQKPNLPLLLGSVGSSLVTQHGNGAHFVGLLDQLVIYQQALSAQEINTLAAQPSSPRGQAVLLACSFDKGDAHDDSGNNHNGTFSGVKTAPGRFGAAVAFGEISTGGTAANGAPAQAAKAPAAKAGTSKGSFVEHGWDRSVPIVARSMTLAGDRLFFAGPPDVVDEEYAFEKLTEKDTAIQGDLVRQDNAFNGKEGGILWSVSLNKAEKQDELKLEGIPVWDGMAVAQGRILVATQDGKVTCFGSSK